MANKLINKRHPLCFSKKISTELICIWQGLVDTTKARDGLQRVPLMAGIGAATFVNDLTREEIAVAAKQLHLFAEASSGAVASNIVAARPASLDLVLAT